jgi:hypothetical protein
VTTETTTPKAGALARLAPLFLFATIVLVFFLLGFLALKLLYPAWDLYAIWRWYSGYVEHVSDLTGMNRYLVRALAILCFVPFYYGASRLAAFSLWELTPFAHAHKSAVKGKRVRGALVLGAMGVFFYLSLYVLTTDQTFHFTSGEALKWYAITPEGVQFFDREGTDPKYGIKLKKVTPQDIVVLRRLQQGEYVAIDPRERPLFNPITGDPQAWYYRHPDGTLEFYDKPGFHPKNGNELMPVTRAIYGEWQEHEKRRASVEKVAAPSAPTAGGVSPVVVLDIDSEPSGADVLVDWTARGRTPLRVAFEGGRARGLLVLLRDGHQAGIQVLDHAQSSQIKIPLLPERPGNRARILLVPDATVAEAAAPLRGRLVDEGFTVLDGEEVREYERQRVRAGGGDNRAFRAWTRARFGVDRVVAARVVRSSRDLGKQELEYLRLDHAVRVEVTVELEATDLSTGDTATVVTAKESGIALDQTQGFNNALASALSQATRELKQRLLG